MSIKSRIEAQKEENEVISYVVYKENTLGYLFKSMGHLMIGVLGASLINGGLDCMHGPYSLLDSDIDNIREASKKDFERFRVVSIGYDLSH
jgi:hypothetical protein